MFFSNVVERIYNNGYISIEEFEDISSFKRFSLENDITINSNGKRLDGKIIFKVKLDLDKEFHCKVCNGYCFILIMSIKRGTFTYPYPLLKSLVSQEFSIKKIPKSNIKLYLVRCTTCSGKGKVDWVSNLIL